MRNIEKARWKAIKKIFGSQQIKLGATYSYQILQQPRQILFTYSRYKFCAKIIGETPRIKILELGCNEGLGTLVLGEYLHRITAVDFDKNAVEWAKSNLKEKTNIIFKYDDFLGKAYGKFDAVVSIDTIEHIPKRQENKFFKTIVNNLNKTGYCIIGTPNISASRYSSVNSKIGHVNLFNFQRLRDTMRKYFINVFMFGMNDEVAHTGFYPMCQYILAIGCANKYNGEK